MSENEVRATLDVHPDTDTDVEVDPDNQADIAEEFAENAGIDPSPHEVEQYRSLQESDDLAP